MNKSKYIIILLLTVLSSCSKKNETCKLIGNLKNAEDVRYLYLKEVTSNTLVDSIKVTEGKIEHEFVLTTPKLFRIHNKRDKYQFRDSKMIWLESGIVEMTGDFNFLKNMSVVGSDSQDEYVKYNTLLDSLNKEITLLQEEVYLHNLDDRVIIKEKIDTIRQMISKNIIQFLKENLDSYVTLSTLYGESYYGKRNLDKIEIKEIFELMPDHLRQTEQGLQINQYIELPAVPQTGEKAMEISQVTPNGDTIRLSDYSGKYILLDFWASWCKPCRSFNKELRKIYEKYNPKGFEILSVSGDNNKNSWIKAIKNDSLSWAQISDLKGWHNEAFLLYDVKYVPRNFLISPDGIILGDKYCNAILLERELSKLLN